MAMGMSTKNLHVRCLEKVQKLFSQIWGKNGDESHRTIRRNLLWFDAWNFDQKGNLNLPLGKQLITLNQGLH